jgi:uncharacterized protein (DUF1330 family)
MTVYGIFNYDVRDKDEYARYQSEAGGAMRDRSFQLLALDSTTTHLEGDPAGHQTVILAFDSEKAFRDWYDSPAYQAAIPIRRGATSPTLSMLVKGID